MSVSVFLQGPDSVWVVSCLPGRIFLDVDGKCPPTETHSTFETRALPLFLTTSTFVLVSSAPSVNSAKLELTQPLSKSPHTLVLASGSLLKRHLSRHKPARPVPSAALARTFKPWARLFALLRVSAPQACFVLPTSSPRCPFNTGLTGPFPDLRLSPFLTSVSALSHLKLSLVFPTSYLPLTFKARPLGSLASYPPGSSNLRPTRPRYPLDSS
jgi:hypothetical protein